MTKFVQRKTLIVCALFTWLNLGCGPAAAEKKAFVVGIDNYKELVPLKNSAYSAETVAKKLKDYGYKVTWLKLEKQGNIKEFYAAWNTFVASLKTVDEIIFYFSGHGISVDNTNYLIPADASYGAVTARDANLPKLLIPFPRLIQDVDKKSIAAAVWILDACRDRPLEIGSKINVFQRVPTGHLFLYAAGDGQKALDYLPNDPKEKKLPSLYTRILVRAIEQFPTIDIGNVLPEINALVAQLARPHKQNPYAVNSLAVNWCFSQCEGQLQKLRYETAYTVEVGRNANLLVAQKAFIGKQVTQNAVYLGKKSRIIDCETRSPDTHPFGCLLLRDISRGNAKAYLNRTIKTQINTNVRLHAPIVISELSSKWSCPVRMLEEGDEIELNGVLELAYAGDTFYWGTVGGNLAECKRRKDSDAT